MSQVNGDDINIIVSARLETEFECKERRTRKWHPSTEIGMNLDSEQHPITSVDKHKKSLSQIKDDENISRCHL